MWVLKADWSKLFFGPTAMDPKVEEFFQFCDSFVYLTDPYKYNLEYEKMYRLMWYQCFSREE